MRRINKVYQYIQDKSALYKKEDLMGRVGIEAEEVAENLGVLRSNVSRELNALQRQGKIIKFSGRPVLFFDKKTLENFYDTTLGDGPFTFDSIEECVQKNTDNKSPFDSLIGAEGSLKKQVEQAKAAILYPPDGLHTLIVGQTGVGKTLLAHMMYEYGKLIGRFSEKSPFIIFNCADYYNNPQLLLAHIFGHIKGAFTGADNSQAGLIERANGGILFLDEIHRLPPEGQEMIFYFIDTGSFNRLGETTRNHQAKVLIICATTEEPNSVLTQTFVRRIPNIIKIQPLSERSVYEKLEITKLLFSAEVQRINKPVKVSLEAIKALIGSIDTGNVGQMKSNIKLICAQAFLNGIDNPDYIEIDFKMLPAQIKNGLLTLSANRKDLAIVSHAVNESIYITPTGGKLVLKENNDEPFNLYQMIEKKINLLKGEGIRNDLIKQILTTDVDAYIKSFYKKQDDLHMSMKDRLLKIIDFDLINFTEKISFEVQKRLKLISQERFLYAFSLHLSIFFKRLKSQHFLPENPIEGTIDREAEEFQLALLIKNKIEDHYHVRVPDSEVDYFAILLSSLKEDTSSEKIMIIVLMHGTHTATSMAEVAKKLFSTDDSNLIAFDMPLEIHPQQIFEKIITKLQELKYSRGILLLVDMGSLCNFGSMLVERLKVPVKTIDMVSTPVVLEAMRKADIVGIGLQDVYDSLKNFRGYETSTKFQNREKGELIEAILTICSSGQGAAVKLQEMIEDIVLHIEDRQIQVIPVGVTNLEKSLEKITKDYKILAAVGVVKPKLDVPFIPLEKVINGEIEAILYNLLDIGVKKKMPDTKNLVLRNFCEDSLQQFLTYLNPSKVIDTLLSFDEILEKSLQVNLNNPLKVRLIVHCGCALERMIMGKGLIYDEDLPEVDTQKLECVKKAAVIFENSIHITLTHDELCFIAEMI